MNQIGEYRQLTPFTNENAGTAEWCMAEKDGRQYFVKKFQSPVYPSKDLGLSETKYQARIAKYHAAIEQKKEIYQTLRNSDDSGTLVVPVEVISYQYHICTIAEYVTGNIKPDEVSNLSEWQRLVLMRTLTLALMKVHEAGVVHGDLRPENVLISQNAENGNCALKLIDFDSSFLESSPPEDIAASYYAPEALNKSAAKPDHRIDIFALGAVFHCFWTGKRPTEGDAPDPSIPHSLQTIISGALQADPDKRISAEEIYSSLEAMLNAHTVKIINLQKPEPASQKKKAIRELKSSVPAESPQAPAVPVPALKTVLEKTVRPADNGTSQKVSQKQKDKIKEKSPGSAKYALLVFLNTAIIIMIVVQFISSYHYPSIHFYPYDYLENIKYVLYTRYYTYLWEFNNRLLFLSLVIIALSILHFRIRHLGKKNGTLKINIYTRIIGLFAIIIGIWSGAIVFPLAFPNPFAISYAFDSWYTSPEFDLTLGFVCTASILTAIAGLLTLFIRKPKTSNQAGEQLPSRLSALRNRLFPSRKRQ